MRAITGRWRRGRMHGARTLLIALGLVVSAVFMYIAVRGAHLGETHDALQTIDYAWLVPSLGFLVLAFFIRAVRWWSLFTPGRRPPLRAVVGAQFVGYLANAVLPVRAGEAAAIVALNKKARTPVAEGTATLFVQRAEDVLSLVVLLFVMLPWLPHVSWLRAAGIVAVVLLIALAIVAALVIRYGEGAIRILVAPLRLLPFVPRDALEHAPTHFVRGLVGLVSPRIAMISFAWTTLSWIVLGIGFWLVLEASGIDLSPLAGVLVVIGIGLAMILPSSPGALGVFEGATVVVLTAYGISDSIALSYALVLHALNIVPLFVVAAVMLALRRLRRRADVTMPFPDAALEPVRPAEPRSSP
jgi:glycosyltransferase 2 family protein